MWCVSKLARSIALAASITAAAGCGGGDAPPELPRERATTQGAAARPDLARSVRAEFGGTLNDLAGEDGHVEVGVVTCETAGGGGRYVCRVQGSQEGGTTSYVVTLTQDGCWSADVQPAAGVQLHPRLESLRSCIE